MIHVCWMLGHGNVFEDMDIRIHAYLCIVMGGGVDFVPLFFAYACCFLSSPYHPLPKTQSFVIGKTGSICLNEDQLAQE